MTHVNTPQTRCRAALARCDITPPVGIYHRMWGAATNDRATGVHRPLTATLLWLEPLEGSAAEALVIVSLDHCILDEPDLAAMRRAIAAASGLASNRVQISLTHTHGAGLMSRSRGEMPGGDLIGPYLDELAEKLAQLAKQAFDQRCPATVVYGRGRCNLAAHRDFFDRERQQFVCGLNPEGPADDTLLVARIVSEAGSQLGTLINYACHPTTLAWENTAISPDYLGALRELVERESGVPCLFLQGASGDLGPREGFIGDWQVADRNGRQLGFAALSTLESLPAPGTRYVYQGPVVSGAVIGTWRHEPLDSQSLAAQAWWQVDSFTASLPYRPDLPTRSATLAERDRWQTDEARALAAGDPARARDFRARIEQMTRQLWRLDSLLSGDAFPLPVTLARLGDAFWLFVPAEHYQSLQTSLRASCPDLPWIISTITNGWQPGYIPAATAYGQGIYQEQIAVVARESAELLTQRILERAVVMK
jgi:hypothetical protein